MHPWTTAAPDHWAEAPAQMTVSTLIEIETCPRRWALASAAYPDLWEHRGYPPKIQSWGLTGIVVHLAVEEATKALVRAGCTSPASPEAVPVLKELGGYSALLESCIERVLARHADNPRAATGLGTTARTLRARVPNMRAQVQQLLARVRLVAGNPTRSRDHAPVQRARPPLGPGVYPELELVAPDINWRGKVDLLTISETSCEIVDFKTGVPSDHHALQLRAYALLWIRDAQLNPTGRSATRLTIAYGSGDVAVEVPSVSAIDAIERELVERASAARKAVSASVPEARPSEETCRHCWVRHMCDEYWAGRVPRESTDQSSINDVELVVASRHGSSSWDGLLKVGSTNVGDRRVLLRWGGPGPDLAVGDRIRVLDAYLTIPEASAEPVVANLGAQSEVFFVP